MMNDRIPLAEMLRADMGARGRVSRRTLLSRLGMAAVLATAASLAATVPAPAQSQQTPGAQPPPPKAAAPKRRGITAPESSAPSPSGDKSKGDDDAIPGGLPGARPKSQPIPGGGPSNPGG